MTGQELINEVRNLTATKDTIADDLERLSATADNRALERMRNALYAYHGAIDYLITAAGDQLAREALSHE